MVNETLELTILITPFIINIALYYLWKYRAKRAMERDNIDYWIESYDISSFCMFMFGLLWLLGTVFMILSMIYDREY
jgi:hypothetical protein